MRKENRKTEKKAISGIMIVLFSIGTMTSIFDVQPTEASTTLVSVYPQENKALIGETFTINITITDVTNLYGWQINLTYNPAIVSVNEIIEGPFLKQVAKTVFTKWINNDAGYVLASASFMPPFPSDGAYGSGDLAYVIFDVDSYGQTLLGFDKALTKLRTYSNGLILPLEHETRDGNFTNLVISCNIDIDPGTLNLKSKGKWITVYIQLPEGYVAADINASSILLNETIPPLLNPRYGFVKDPNGYLIDHNNDGTLERMVKFDRASVESFIYDQGIGFSNVPLAVTGRLFDGTPFEGTGTIIVSKPFRLYNRR